MQKIIFGAKFISTMTRQEFIKLAKNPPHPGGPSFFCLQQITTEKTLERGQHRYPKYEVSEAERYYFPALKEAEQKMRKLIADTKVEDCVVICYIIDEIPFCAGQYADENVSGGDRLTWRVYDATGQMLNQSKVSSLHKHLKTEYGLFRGRTEKEWRFKEGDIVEVLDLYTKQIRLAVCMGHGFTIGDCWDMYKRLGETHFRLDITDDILDITDGPGFNYHDHVSPGCLFQPHFPIPESIRLKFQEYYQTVCDHEEYIDNIPFFATNISRESTGLTVNVWVTIGDKDSQPYIRFQNNKKEKLGSIYQSIPMYIRRHHPYIRKADLAKVKIPDTAIESIKKWVVKNYDLIMEMWNGNLYSDDFCNAQKKN